MKNARADAAKADMEHDGPTEQNSPAGWTPKGETYPVEADGKTRRVSVPQDPTPVELLEDAMKDNLGPYAIAAIAARLAKVRTVDQDVTQQVKWFRQRLVVLLGGPGAANRMATALGM